MRPCDRNIKRTIQLTQEMIELADQGDADREDTGCGVLYGVLRDSAYKIQQLAKKEKGRHQAKGWWTAHGQPENDRSDAPTTDC
ncbi:MAG: hypothetical protein PVG41_06645 [Desulfobacteraceae bacterium]